MKKRTYDARPACYWRKELPQALVDAYGLINAEPHPVCGFTLPPSVQIGDEHYAVRPYINIGPMWAANAAVLSPYGVELKRAWEATHAT